MSANEGAVATRTFRVSGVCILYFVSCCSFLFFLTANKSLQQVLQAFQEVLPADTVVFSQAVSESRPLAHSLVGDDQSFCNRTKRCDPIPLQEAKISFVHISKNGGSSWIRELLKLKPAPERYPTSLDAMSEGFTKIGLYPIKENGPEHGIPFQDNLLQHAKPYYRFISLRSPRHHVWSMFSFCYYSNWGKKVSKPAFPRGNPNNDLIDFERWLDHFLDDSKEHMLLVDPKSPLGCYEPQNYQSRVFLVDARNPHKTFGIPQPNWTETINTYWDLDWVGLTDFFHESKCLMFHRFDTRGLSSSLPQDIQKYLEAMCHCGSSPVEVDTSGTQLLDENVTHASFGNGHRNTLLDLPEEILRKVDLVSSVDRALYETALEQFIKEVVWMESNLQRRVLCDSVIDKWHKELGYLRFGLKETYEKVRQEAGLIF